MLSLLTCLNLMMRVHLIMNDMKQIVSTVLIGVNHHISVSIGRERILVEALHARHASSRDARRYVTKVTTYVLRV